MNKNSDSKSLIINNILKVFDDEIKALENVKSDIFTNENLTLDCG